MGGRPVRLISGQFFKVLYLPLLAKVRYNHSARSGLGGGATHLRDPILRASVKLALSLLLLRRCSMRVTRVHIAKRKGVFHIAFETVGVSGKRIKVNLGTLSDLKGLKPMIEKGREAQGLAAFAMVRGGM
jgi:hypothetical protein